MADSDDKLALALNALAYELRQARATGGALDVTRLDYVAGLLDSAATALKKA